jgi:hypothetical protein
MSTPRHLTYDSLEAWAEGENIPKDWESYPEKQRDVWITQFGELHELLRTRHLATLSEDEQQQFKARTHPSLSHKFQERAQPFTALLKEELARLGYCAEVTLGFYHFDNIVLDAHLDLPPPDWLNQVHWLRRGDRLRDLPSLFRGFMVGYQFSDTDAANAPS